ncbi:MAG: OmpA family protein, partial [Pseudobdellovibrionaceae bacterium]
NLEFAADTTAGKWALGANFGYRWRTPGKKFEDIPIEPFRNQYILSGAASYLFQSIDTKMIFEIFSSFPANSKDSNFNRRQSSAEFLAGLKHDFSSSLAGHFGAGTELAQGAGSPDYRIYLGLNYTIGPLFAEPEPAQVTKIDNNTADAEVAVSAGDPYAGGIMDDEPQELSDQSVDAIFAKTPVAGEETFLLGDILFDFNKDTLVPKAKLILNKLSAYVMRPPAYSKLVIEGHTDSVGSRLYNQDLSERRAKSVEIYLTQARAMNPRTVEAYGYGEDKPIADNGNYQGRMKNRRVEIVITRPRDGGSEAMPGYSEERIRPTGTSYPKAAPAKKLPPKKMVPRKPVPKNKNRR